jgi:hypothetical protein
MMTIETIDMEVLMNTIIKMITEILMTIATIDMEVLMIKIIKIITDFLIINIVIIVLMVLNVFFIMTKKEDRDLKGGR